MRIKRTKLVDMFGVDKGIVAVDQFFVSTLSSKHMAHVILADGRRSVIDVADLTVVAA